MKEATSSLAKAKALHDDLETIYVAAINFNTVDKIREDIQTEINTIADLSVVTGV
jgi:hypothetical protein